VESAGNPNNGVVQKTGSTSPVNQRLGTRQAGLSSPNVVGMRARPQPLPWYVMLVLACAAACSQASFPDSAPSLEEPRVWNGPPVWLESPMVKIRPQTTHGSQRQLTLFAARNEFVSFQVAFHGGQTGMAIDSVSLPALEGPGLIQGNDIVLYRETFLDITQPSSQDSQSGLWPDGLIPDVDELLGEKRLAFPFVVPPGEARAVWVDVHVPRDAPPGRYEGSAWVTTREGERIEAKIRLTVLKVLLPSTPSLKTAFSLGSGFVCQAYTGKQECGDEVLLRLLPLFYRLGLEHRITLVGRFPSLSWEDPLDLPNWQTFEQSWGPFLDGTTSSRLSGARVTSWQYPGPSSANSLAGFVRETSVRGWLPRAFNYVGDEPPLFSTFDEVRQRAQLTRQDAPELRTLLSSNIDILEKQGLEDLVDIIAVLINSLNQVPAGDSSPRERYRAFLSRPDRELWLYQSCMSHGCGAELPENLPGQGWPSYVIDSSAAKSRALEWVSFLEGATGELYYNTVEALDSAWTDQLRYSGNGDGTLFYPGLPALIGGTTEVPLPSLRLKLIRLGFQDYEWLQAVSEAGDPEYARWLARQIVPEPWRVPDDGSLFEAARLCLMRRFLQLRLFQDPSLALSLIDVPCPESLGGPP
jgi:Domain of unknown function (DUF4091)